VTPRGLEPRIAQCDPAVSDHFKKGEAMATKYKSYLEFLETAVASENLKKNDPKKWEEMKAKLKKERFLVKLKVK
jgi:predicted DNA-binding protein YlxM (UPF0122 family)